jgi:N6-adenosine-specific RNA methylase IME4
MTNYGRGGFGDGNGSAKTYRGTGGVAEGVLFPCVVTDPPWRFGDNLPGPGRGAEKHYPCMDLPAIISYHANLPIAADAWVFIWRVGAMQHEALQLCDALELRVISEIVWVKTVNAVVPGQPGKPRMGMGRSVRNCHEVALVTKRGKPERSSGGVPSVLFAPRGEHSAKPELFFDHIEELCPGPRLEVFARRQRAGWTCIGNEATTRTSVANRGSAL